MLEIGTDLLYDEWIAVRAFVAVKPKENANQMLEALS